MEEYKKHERLAIRENKHLVVEEHILLDIQPLHWHSYFEIEILFAGSGDCIINDDKFETPKYNVFLLTPTDFHSYRAVDETRFINICFDNELISESDIVSLVFSNNDNAYRFEDEEFERIFNAAKLLKHEYESDGECQRQLLHYIIRKILNKNTLTDKADNNNTHSRGIKNAIIFTELHFRENIKLSDVAEAAGYAPAYFSDIYRRATGETYSESLCRLRLANARMMLANGFSVSDACYLSGFGSLSNFLEAFKKKYGIPPSKYIKEFSDKKQ